MVVKISCRPSASTISIGSVAQKGEGACKHDFHPRLQMAKDGLTGMSLRLIVAISLGGAKANCLTNLKHKASTTKRQALNVFQPQNTKPRPPENPLLWPRMVPDVSNQLPNVRYANRPNVPPWLNPLKQKSLVQRVPSPPLVLKYPPLCRNRQRAEVVPNALLARVPKPVVACVVKKKRPALMQLLCQLPKPARPPHVAWLMVHRPKPPSVTLRLPKAQCVERVVLV